MCFNVIYHTIRIVTSKREQQLNENNWYITVYILKYDVFWFLGVYHYQSNILRQTISKYKSLSITVRKKFRHGIMSYWKQKIQIQLKVNNYKIDMQYPCNVVLYPISTSFFGLFIDVSVLFRLNIGFIRLISYNRIDIYYFFPHVTIHFT